MLDKVAPEIATAILLYTGDDGYNMTELLDKRLVSVGWRGFIDGVPCVWRNVNLLASQKFVDFQMEHAGKVGLNVVVDVDGRRSRYGKEWVVKRKERIVKLTLLTQSEGVLRSLIANTAFPLLRALTIRSKGYGNLPKIRLSPLPATTVDPLRLLSLHLSHILYPISSLTAHPNLQSLSLSFKPAFDAKIPLAELITVLPGLASLETLGLEGQFDIAEMRTGTHPIPLPLLDFSFRGHMADLDAFFDAFDLASVQTWRFGLEIQKAGVPEKSRLRDVFRRCAHITKTVVLRWDGKLKCFVDFFDDLYPAKFDLSLVVHDAAPCQAMTEVVAGVGELVLVDNLTLHGGPRTLDVCEADDLVIERMMKAMPNVKRLTVCSNGNSWERIPVVLVSTMRAGGDVWRDLEIVKFSKGLCLGYTMADWIKLFGERNERGLQVSEVEFDGWSLQASGTRERATLSWDLWNGVKDVKGTWK